MAIIGVRSAGIQGVKVGVKTDLIIHMDNGTIVGESNTLPAGTATNVLGRALNFAGNKAATRIYSVCNINRHLAP